MNVLADTSSNPKRDGRKQRKDRTEGLASYVRDRILDDIVQRKLAAGDIVQIQSLANRYQVSRTPVREALSQLQREGLVESLPYKGYFVRPMDPSEFDEIFYLRELLEGDAAERAAREASGDDLAALAAMRPPADTVGMSLEYDRYAHAFHALIARASGSRRLYDMFEQLYTDVRRLQYAGVGRPSALHSSLEHDEIVRALEQRDPEQARLAMIRHIREIRSRALVEDGHESTIGSGTILGRKQGHLHRVFDNSLPPIHSGAPGDMVTFECPMCAVPRGAAPSAILALDPNHPHTIVGPVRIEGADCGDTLAIEILAIEPIQEYGQCMIVPNFGLLSDEFPEPYIQTFELTETVARMKPGIEIPLRPFCGIMAVAPLAPGVHGTTPPRPTGGNMDIARLGAGSTLFLPVQVPGALFSCGDGHAAQGWGEVCGTAVETKVRVTVRFHIERDEVLAEPRFLTAPSGRSGSGRGCYVTTASGPDLFNCSRRAVRYMIDYLGQTRSLSREEAYVLCSVAVELRIEEIVDQPNWLVSASLPLDIFVG